MISKSKKLSKIALPEYKGDRLYMHQFDISNPILPKEYERWNETIKNIISHSPKKDGIAYVTIDELEVKCGETHRRGGKHTDGNYLFGWGGGGSGWLTGENGRVLPREKHIQQYCSDGGGMLIVSSYEGCDGWNGEYDGEPNQGGNCDHIDVSKLEKFTMEKNVIYWGNSTFIHESLPMDKDIKRQLIRITLPADSPII